MDNIDIERFAKGILEDMRPGGFFHGWPISDVVEYVSEGNGLDLLQESSLRELLEKNC